MKLHRNERERDRKVERVHCFHFLTCILVIYRNCVRIAAAIFNNPKSDDNFRSAAHIDLISKTKKNWWNKKKGIKIWMLWSPNSKGAFSEFY